MDYRSVLLRLLRAKLVDNYVLGGACEFDEKTYRYCTVHDLNDIVGIDISGFKTYKEFVDYCEYKCLIPRYPMSREYYSEELCFTRFGSGYELTVESDSVKLIKDSIVLYAVNITDRITKLFEADKDKAYVYVRNVFSIVANSGAGKEKLFNENLDRFVCRSLACVFDIIYAGSYYNTTGSVGRLEHGETLEYGGCKFVYNDRELDVTRGSKSNVYYLGDLSKIEEVLPRYEYQIVKIREMLSHIGIDTRDMGELKL